MREHSDGRRHEAPVRDLFGGDERLGVADEVSREAWGDALVAISGEAHGVAWRPWAKALVG